MSNLSLMASSRRQFSRCNPSKMSYWDHMSTNRRYLVDLQQEHCTDSEADSERGSSVLRRIGHSAAALRPGGIAPVIALSRLYRHLCPSHCRTHELNAAGPQSRSAGLPLRHGAIGRGLEPSQLPALSREVNGHSHKMFCSLHLAMSISLRLLESVCSVSSNSSGVTGGRNGRIHAIRNVNYLCS